MPICLMQQESCKCLYDLWSDNIAIHYAGKRKILFIMLNTRKILNFVNLSQRLMIHDKKIQQFFLTIKTCANILTIR